MRDLYGLAVGIGSLPYQNAQQAIAMILRACPQAPFWPQLPRRDSREGMVTQFTEGFPCLKMTPGGLAFSAQDKEAQLEAFYEKMINRQTGSFRLSRDYAEGLYAFEEYLRQADTSGIKYIKCHITGPFTVAASLKDETGTMLVNDPVFMQVIINGLAMKALWQASFFEKYGKKIIMFIDEPYLGCFGSAYTPINRDEVVQGLGELTSTISGAGMLTGVHCCGNTDWSLFTDIPTLDIINFDAYGYQDKFLLYAQDLRKFMARDGIICWGVVPTQESTRIPHPRELAKKIEEGVAILAAKGLDKEVLLANMLVSPSCGLGALDPAVVEHILKALSGVSRHFQKRQKS